MAKLISPFDYSSASRMINLFGVLSSLAIREWGALEYSTTYNKNASGAKVVSAYDLSSYSQLVNKAGTLFTTLDARGASVATTREWGPLEYNSSISYTASPKLVSHLDYAGYSPMINYYRTNSNPYLPSMTDARGITAPYNAGFTHNTEGQYQTVSDARTTTAIDSMREWGALEYDTALLIESTYPSLTEISDAVWQKSLTTLGTTTYTNTAGASVASHVLRNNVAAGGGSSTITLDSGASSVDDFYNDSYIVIIGGTGAGQTKRIADYTGSTRLATLGSAWITQPNTTSVYVIIPFFSIENAVWNATLSSHVTTGTTGAKLSSLAKPKLLVGGEVIL